MNDGIHNCNIGRQESFPEQLTHAKERRIFNER